MVSISKEEHRTFLQLVEELKKSDRPIVGRVAFLKANPICERCKEAGTDCIVSSSKTNVGCLPCSRTRKTRCPRQQAFGLAYIAQQMSKPLGFVIYMYEEYCRANGSTKSGTAIWLKATEKSKKVDSASIERDKKTPLRAPQVHDSKLVQKERVVIEIFDDEDEVSMDGVNADHPHVKVKEEVESLSASHKEVEVGSEVKAPADEMENNEKFTLLTLNRRFALLRLFFRNAMKPYQVREDRRLGDVDHALKKMEAIGQGLSKALDLGEAIGVDKLEMLVGDLAVCKDKLSMAIDVLGGEPGVEKLRKHRSDLEDILLGFGAVLEQA